MTEQQTLETTTTKKHKSVSLDVTHGTIYKQLVKLGLPIFFSSFFQQMQLICNAWVVGQFAGTDAFAALQSTASICDLTISFCVGLGIGSGVIVSQYFGAKRYEDVSKAVHTAIGLSVVIGLIVSIVGFIAVPHVLALMDTPQEIMPLALDFIRLFMVAMFFSVIYNIGSSLQRSVGDTKTPSYVVASTCVLNAVLDIVFVAGLKLDTLGCGLATLISLIYGCIVTLVMLTHTQGCWKITIPSIRIIPHYARKMLICGLPLAVQGSMFGFSNMIVQHSINIFGTIAIAGWGLSARLTSFVWMASEALGSSVTTFAAQNFGARNIERMKKGTYTALLIACIMVGGFCIGLPQVARPLAHIFVNSDEVIDLTLNINNYTLPFMVFYTFFAIFSGTIRGSGESLMPMIITIIGTCILRVIWVEAVMPIYPDLIMILISYPASWVVTAGIFAVYYFKGKWLTRGA